MQSYEKNPNQKFPNHNKIKSKYRYIVIPLYRNLEKSKYRNLEIPQKNEISKFRKKQLNLPSSVAVGISRAAPELLARVYAFLGNPFYHRFAAFGAHWSSFCCAFLCS